MKDVTKYIYFASMILLALVLLFLQFNNYSLENSYRNKYSIIEVTDYEFHTYENEEVALGITQEYQFPLKDISSQGDIISFYTSNQEVELFIGDELIYSLKAHPNNHLTQAVGGKFIHENLSPEDSGKTLRVLIHPLYKSSINIIPKFYIGNQFSIYNYMIRSDLFLLIGCIFLLLFGFLCMLFTILNKNGQRSVFFENGFLFGIFTFLVGLWQITSLKSMLMIFNTVSIISTISIITQAMLPVPFVMFIRILFNEKKQKILDFITLGCSIISFISIILQLFGIFDLKQTLPMIHFFILLVCICIFILSVLACRERLLSIRDKITVISCWIFLFSVMIQIIGYYILGFKSNTCFLLIAFLLFFTVVISFNIKDTAKLINKGKKASHYRNIAYHDELTGLYNRAFYSEYLKKHNLKKASCYIIMFDVNNLKKCNDGSGHEKGDQLLKHCAFILKKSFPTGSCIRLGGDEFCVIFEDFSDSLYEAYLRNYKLVLSNFNESDTFEFPISIAHGYANYMEDFDFDFNDTLRRADKMMYEMKINMKMR